MSEISDPVKKWKATQAKLEAAQMEDAAPAADSDSDEDLDEVCLFTVPLGDWLEKKNVPAIIIKQQFGFAISTT